MWPVTNAIYKNQLENYKTTETEEGKIERNTVFYFYNF